MSKTFKITMNELDKKKLHNRCAVTLHSIISFFAAISHLVVSKTLWFKYLTNTFFCMYNRKVCIFICKLEYRYWSRLAATGGT